MTRLSGKASAVGYRDILLGMCLMLSVVLGLVLKSINPPVIQEDAAKQPGNIIVSAVWPEGDTDVDLWLSAPGDKKAIGYSNRSGSVWNLLRDDLGTANDNTPMNYESAFSRGTPAGEYVVNVHCFKCSGPIPVVVEVRIGAPGQPSKVLKVETIVLEGKGAEVTAIRFKLDGDGRVVPGSVNKIFKPLRDAK